MKTDAGPHDLRAIAHQAMIDRGLEPDFPADAIQQLNGIQAPARESSNSIRDLRDLPWCSIDNDSSRDLDQLTVAAKGPSGEITISVAVADVDALVKAGTPIDRHAGVNTTSVYTAAQIFAMLPEKLSTDLTSLNEGEDRLAVVIEMTVAADGTVESSDIYRALVKNQAKLAYPSVAAWLEGGDHPPAKVAQSRELAEQLRMQDAIAQVMKTVRYRHGAIDLETIEPHAVLRDQQVVDLRVEKKNRAQELIEDFMIAANGVSAQFLQKRGWPALRRIVRTPAHWDRIQEVAQGLGDPLPSQPDPKALAQFLERRRHADPLRFPDLSLTIVKLLGAGEYVLQLPGENSAGHFGLAVQDYSHSTAPNRRYPDLITQRLLKAALANGPPPYSTAELGSLAAHCTEQENAAQKVERRVRKSVAAEFLANRIGESFDGIVTGASEKGTWVRLLNPPAEGRLLDQKDPVQVGDRIRVQLSGLNVQRGFIDFVADDHSNMERPR